MDQRDTRTTSFLLHILVPLASSTSQNIEQEGYVALDTPVPWTQQTHKYTPLLHTSAYFLFPSPFLLVTKRTALGEFFPLPPFPSFSVPRLFFLFSGRRTAFVHFLQLMRLSVCTRSSPISLRLLFSTSISSVETGPLKNEENKEHIARLLSLPSHLSLPC